MDASRRPERCDLTLEFIATNLEGLLRVRARRSADERGIFTKLFHAPSFAARGLVTSFAELYYSASHRNVVRGMHFQLPPHDHAKIVACQAGHAFDVVVDLRTASPTYGVASATELDAGTPEALYIPAGFAHGFQALQDDTLMVYLVSTDYSAEHDSGILWSSLGLNWPGPGPILSARDRLLPTLAEFRSPF